jgi:hypothetical protein
MLVRDGRSAAQDDPIGRRRVRGQKEGMSSQGTGTNLAAGGGAANLGM